MKEDRKDVACRFSVDQFLALLLLPIILLILGILYLVVVPLQGRPFLFSAERMRGPKETFTQHKIRTMHPIDRVVEQSVMGGDLEHRVTSIGTFLRKTRLDELPQIINILQGDMVFIGPRPPLQKYINSDPAYARSLEHVRPGVTGLATVLLHAREERILAKCKNAAETDRAYRTYCIPLKIRMDELYMRKKSIRLKLFILWRTVSGLAISEASVGLCKTIWNGVLRRIKHELNVSDDKMRHTSPSTRRD